MVSEVLCIVESICIAGKELGVKLQCHYLRMATYTQE